MKAIVYILIIASLYLLALSRLPEIKQTVVESLQVSDDLQRASIERIEQIEEKEQ